MPTNPPSSHPSHDLRGPPDRGAFYRAVHAVVDGDATSLRRMLAERPGLAQTRGSPDFHATLLHYVAANGVEDELQRSPPNSVEIARILLESGAEVDAISDSYRVNNQDTPLCLLVSSAHPHEAGVQSALVDVLCEAGARVDGLDGDGAPLSTSLAFWYPRAAARLIQWGAGIDNVLFAAAAGRVDLVTASFDDGGELIDRRTYFDPFRRPLVGGAFAEYALVKAGLCGQAEVVRALLTLGVDVDGRPIGNRTALHEAAWVGNAGVARRLLDHGADLRIRDAQFDATPLGWASHAGHTEVVELLGGPGG